MAREALTTTLTPSLVRECVLSQPGGAAMLLALVSALERAGLPDGPRVVIVGAQAPRIVEWLVAGTLLLPRARALALGFKVFAGDPATAGVPVVGVHPDDVAGLTADAAERAGYAVFDLPTGAFTDTAPTAHALRWVGLFLEQDPRDVVAALDVAADCGLEPPEAAAALGLAAVLRRDPDQRHAEAVAGWLRTGPADLRGTYAGQIAETFTGSVRVWPVPVLELLDAAGCDDLLQGRRPPSGSRWCAARPTPPRCAPRSATACRPRCPPASGRPGTRARPGASCSPPSTPGRPRRGSRRCCGWRPATAWPSSRPTSPTGDATSSSSGPTTPPPATTRTAGRAATASRRRSSTN
ncbi:hypothetical protein OHA72_23780 [Dactylosporangium sp. NBC_01737]|nr:hypothetical protein OHA72_23780 [Dactylosporangium sp. NBC_01737]